MLPILKHRKDILQHIKNSPVTVLSADTGTGKSTQIPQFLHRRHPRGLILSAQPRRIAAISLAKRVAFELGGDDYFKSTVCYAIGDDSNVDWRHCRILFVTIGWFLLRIVHDPEFFYQRCTHVLLDDVHERSLEGDTLFLVIKQFMRDLPYRSPKLVLMSATMEVDLICRYFSSPPDSPLTPLNLSDGAACFPVERVYLGNLHGRYPFISQLQHQEKMTLQLFSAFSGTLSGDPYPANGKVFDGIWKLLATLLAGLLTHHAASPFGVMIFVPGVTWIDELYNRLDLELRSRAFPHLLLVPLHASQGPEDHDRILRLSNSQFSVVLTTNIAESSLTLPNIRYVIDYGLHRTTFYNRKTRRSALMTNWASHSNLLQRGGRSGRTCPGDHICLFPESIASRMDDFPPSEMRRVSLAATVLTLKCLSQKVPSSSLFTDPKAALMGSIDPPSIASLDAAAEELFERQILRSRNSDSSSDPRSVINSQVTAFGAMCQLLPLNFDLVRLILFGARSGRYINHAVVMAAYVAHDSLFPGLSHQPSDLYAHFRTLELTQLGRQNSDGHDMSDLIAGLRIFNAVLLHTVGKFQSRQLYFTKVRSFIQLVSELCQHLIPHLPHHRHWLQQLRLMTSPHAALHRHNSDKFLSLTPMDVAYCKFMIAHVFVPINDLMIGTPAVLKQSRHINLLVPYAQRHSFKADFGHVFDAILPFIHSIHKNGDPKELQTSMKEISASGELYQPLRIEFTHLDSCTPPYTFTPLPLRVLDIATMPGSKNFLRFPFFSLDGGKPVPHPLLLWVKEKKGNQLKAEWNLNHVPCILHDYSILSYLAVTRPSIPAVAVCASLITIVNRKTEKYHCQDITVLNNDPLLFALMMLTLSFVPLFREGVDHVRFRNQTFPLGFTIAPGFFKSSQWQQYRILTDNQWFESDDRYAPIPCLDSQFLHQTLQLLSSHSSSPLQSSLLTQKLSAAQEQTLFLALCRIYSSAKFEAYAPRP